MKAINGHIRQTRNLPAAGENEMLRTITGNATRLSKGIVVLDQTEINNNTLQNLKVGVQVNTNVYDQIKIQQNYFTDNLFGIKFITSTHISLISGGNEPPVITCNTFSAAGIAGITTTVGIHLEPGVSMIQPSQITQNNLNRLGEYLSPSGNKFNNVSEPVRNDGAVSLVYYKFDGSADEATLIQINGITGGIIPMPDPNAKPQNACGGSNNPGVNSRMAGSGNIASNDIHNLLGYCFPNPAAVETIIPFSLPDNCFNARLLVREVISGRIIQTIELKPTQKQASISIDLQKFNAGLYAYTLVVDNKPVATRLLEVKK